MNIGDNIKKYRKLAHITQVQLAKKIGKSVSSVQKYELNTVKPDFSVLDDIANALDVSVNDLLGLNLTDDKEVREFLYNDNQNRLINILKIYGYKVFEEGNNFTIVKDDTVKELSESQFNNVELFIDEYINFVVNK